jgi:hypothetical protein
MFGFFSKKRKASNAFEEMIFAVYGNPPPAKRANVTQAVEIATDLVGDQIADAEISRLAIGLNDGPMPYSTHDLGLAVAMHFLLKPENVPTMFTNQLMLRMQMLEWLGEGLVAPALVKSFEASLYRLYKPGG